MSKYSFDFKKQVVLEYLDGQGGTTYLANLHGIPNHAQIQRWIAAYKNHGDIGLRRSRQKQSYSFEQKLYMVELYLSSELSYQDIALQEGVRDFTTIAKWVSDFRIAGPDALKDKRKGRTKTLDKSKKTIVPVDTVSVDTSAEHIKQLEDELLKLRIENAFLKELRRLRLEGEAKMKDLQESSAVSEDSLN